MLVPVHPHPAVISAWANAPIVVSGIVRPHKRIIARSPGLCRDFEMRITVLLFRFIFVYGRSAPVSALRDWSVPRIHDAESIPPIRNSDANCIRYRKCAYQPDYYIVGVANRSGRGWSHSVKMLINQFI
jgi:hypothetical protein